jgi:hypothetical protein
MVIGDYGVARALHRAIITCEKLPMKPWEWAAFVRYGAWPPYASMAEIPLCFGKEMFRPPNVGHKTFSD